MNSWQLQNINFDKQKRGRVRENGEEIHIAKGDMGIVDWSNFGGIHWSIIERSLLIR